MIPDIANSFYPAFTRGKHDIAEQIGCDLIAHDSGGKLEDELFALHGRPARGGD